MTGAANGAFGKDTDNVALVELVARAVERFDDIAAIVRRDGDRAHQAKKPIERFEIIVVAVQHEADEARHAGADQQRVDERNVVADEQRRAALWNIFLADNLNAI